ncbi:hypothetical protein AAFN85_02960 [Mucilaginibacter sp. CAU 1740]|uniref:hypothetical protein n=1 Tax=Mucilaginibacter sp. CAU 1740 TaxID=3140365 RepID=UPI00325AA57E
MTGSKSKYELMLADIAAKSKKVPITDAENFQIIRELNEGMEDFLLTQKKIEKNSANHLRGVCLNA